MNENVGPSYVEDKVEPVVVELPSVSVTIVAVTPAEPEQADDATPQSPFVLPATEPVILPVVISTELGPVALRFETRRRALEEEPRRTSLSEKVSLATGDSALDDMPEGVDLQEVPAWVVAGRETADMQMLTSFPLAGTPRGMTLHYLRDGGRGGRVLMSTETTQRHQDAVEAAFLKFNSANPGMIDALEKGLALMDARILRFWGSTLRETADRQAFMLEQGAEVIEEMVGPVQGTDGNSPSP